MFYGHPYRTTLIKANAYWLATETYLLRHFKRDVAHELMITYFNGRFLGPWAMTESEYRDMAKNSPGFAPIEWVDIPLTGQAAKDFKTAWDSGDDTLLDDVAQCGLAGHKFSVSFDTRNNGWRCTVTVTDSTNPNYGRGFSSHGSSPVQVMCVSAYKILTVCKGGLWDSAATPEFG